MRCEESAEFVSAVCDGDLIPRDAAGHLEECVACRARLIDYVEMGAELRLMASAELSEQGPVREWEKKQRSITNLWAKGWETMRVPRFAFGLLLAAVVVLGSSLVATRARAHGEGSVVMFSVTASGGKANSCPMPTTGKLDWVCGFFGRDLSYKIRVIAMERDRVKLGVQSNYHKSSGESDHWMSSEELSKLPEETYWFSPGEKLQIPVEGTGPIQLTGEWMDHVPPMPVTPNMDPNAGEMRIFSPILLKGKTVVIDMEGGSASVDEKEGGVELYGQGEGRIQFALSPFEGANKAKISGNRINFESDGQSYVLVTGAPVARSESAWIRRQGKFVPARSQETGYIATFKLSEADDPR